MSFSLTILGSSSALPTSEKISTAHVLNIHEQFFLIDCGEAAQIQLRKYKIRFSRINHIFISHLHGDHYFGLFGLLSSFNLLGRKHDLHIYSHSDLQIKLKTVFHNEIFSYKIFYHDLNFKEPEIILSTKSLIVKSFPLKHRVPACGFLFSERNKERNIISESIAEYKLSIAQILKIKKGEDLILPDGTVIENKKLTKPPFKARAYAFCSDTQYYEKIISEVQGVDLLYHEATFGSELQETAKKTGHSTTKDAALIAKKANVSKLIIGHFSSRYKDTEILLNEAKEVFENTVKAEEGKEFSIEQERESE